MNNVNGMILLDGFKMDIQSREQDKTQDGEVVKLHSKANLES